MNNIKCPRCNEASITPSMKFKTGRWRSIYCPNCNQRLAAHPIPLALIYFALVWDVILFGFLAIYDKNWIYALIMIAGMLILEFFSYFIPLACLRPKETKKNTDSKNAK